jgi:hypothetical protein
VRPGENVVREPVHTAVLPFGDLLGGNEFVEELDHEVFVGVVMDDVLQVFVLLTYDVLHGLDRLYYGNGEKIVKMDYVRNPVLIPIHVVWVQRGKDHWVVDMPLRRYAGQEG